MYEMIDRDAFGRIGSLETEHGSIKTPTVLPVISPTRQMIDAGEIVEEIGAQALITNAFLLYRDPEIRRDVLRRGIHDFLGVDCPVATDSGGYQIYRGGKVDVSPEKIHGFQSEIGSDLAVVLDVPPRDEMGEEEAESCIEESISRSRQLFEDKNDGPLWYGVVHLTPHGRLRRREAGIISDLPFDIFALGSCVGSLIEYRFEEHVERVIDTAKRMDPARPRHIFGVGHPMFIALSSAMGGDLFDSAMYALSAQHGRYLTARGTLRTGDLRELPCSCPVCLDHSPSDLSSADGVDLLGRHNLYATFEELRRVRQAISENKLWELVQVRSRGHPRLLGALESGLRKHRKFLEGVDPITKKSALFYSGPETRLRPEVTRARRMIRERKVEGNEYHHPLYGGVPQALSLCYPMGQTEMPGRLVRAVKEADVELDQDIIVKGSLDFQFTPGYGNAMEPFTVKRSRRTGRIRHLFRKGRQVGTFRARDFYFLPSIEGARILHEYAEYPGLRVVMDDDAAPFVADGKSAFAKFVVSCDPAIVPGQEVLVVDISDRLLATGTAMMNRMEMECFKVGVAVNVRHGVGGMGH